MFFGGVLTALLRYNSHIIQFTHFKCTIQQFLVYSQKCAVITTISFRTWNLYSVTVTPSPPHMAATNLSAVSVDLPVLYVNINGMWCFVTGFFHLVQYFHLCWSMFKCFMSFYGCIRFHGMGGGTRWRRSRWTWNTSLSTDTPSDTEVHAEHQLRADRSTWPAEKNILKNPCKTW